MVNSDDEILRIETKLKDCPRWKNDFLDSYKYRCYLQWEFYNLGRVPINKSMIGRLEGANVLFTGYQLPAMFTPERVLSKVFVSF